MVFKFNTYIYIYNFFRKSDFESGVIGEKRGEHAWCITPSTKYVYLYIMGFE